MTALLTALTFLAFLFAGKFSLAQTLLLTLVSLLLFTGWAATRTFKAHTSAPLFLLLFCLSLASSLYSPDPLQSLSFSGFFLLALLASLLLPSALPALSSHTLRTLLLLTTAAACLEGFFQYASLGSHFLLFSFYFNPNVFAGFLILVLPIFFHSFFQTSGGIRFRYGLGIALVLIALFLTQSRGALLSLLLATPLALRSKRAWQLTLLVSLLLVLSIFLHPLKGVKWPRHLSQDRSLLFRELIYKSTLRGIAKRPLGYGAYTFRTVYPRLKLGGASTLMAHNAYLQMALELGFPGLFFFLLTLFYLLSKKSPPFRTALLAFALHNLVDYTFYFPSHLLLFLFLVFLDEKEQGIERTWRLKREELALLALPLIFATLFLFQANRALEQAEDLNDEHSFQASQQLLSQVPFSNLSLRALKLHAQNLLWLGKPALAVKVLQQALRLDPHNPDLLYPLAVSYLHLHQESKALALLEEAQKRKPTDLLILRELGLTDLKMGATKKAEKVFRKLLQTATSPYQSDAYAPLPGMQEKNRKVAAEAQRVLTLLEFQKKDSGKHRKR